ARRAVAAPGAEHRLDGGVEQGVAELGEAPVVRAGEITPPLEERGLIADVVTPADDGEAVLEGGAVEGARRRDHRDAGAGREARDRMECRAGGHVLYSGADTCVTLARRPRIVKWPRSCSGSCCSSCAGRWRSSRSFCIRSCGSCCCHSVWWGSCSTA